jgi:hypothetical protein
VGLFFLWPIVLLAYLLIVTPLFTLFRRPGYACTVWGFLNSVKLILLVIIGGPLYYSGIVSISVYYTGPETMRTNGTVSFMEAWLPMIFCFIAGFHVFLNRAIPDSVRSVLFDEAGDYVDRQLKELNSEHLKAAREEAKLDVHPLDSNNEETMTAAAVLDAVKGFDDVPTSGRGWTRFALLYFLPAFFSVVHCLIPTIWRTLSQDGKGLLTNLSPEDGRASALTVYSIHVIMSFFVLTFIFNQLTDFALKLIDSISDLRRLGTITEPMDATKAGFAFFVYLEENQNAVNWMVLRSALRQDTANSWHRPFMLMRPLLILEIFLIVLVFVRVVIFNAIEVSTILGLYDLIVLSAYLLLILFMLVTVNEVILDEHLYCVKRRQYEVAARVVELQRSSTSKGQNHRKTEATLVSYQLQLLQKIQHRMEDPFYQLEIGVSLFGNVVRQQGIQRLAVVAASSVVASLADVISQYVSETRRSGS